MTKPEEVKGEIVEDKRLVCPFLPPTIGRTAMGQSTINYLGCIKGSCQLWDKGIDNCGLRLKGIKG